MSPDYYELLGCRRGSTAREIKSAYHRLISRFHPDRNPDPGAAEFTARLNEAYSVLSDDRKRVLYDAWIESSQHPKETGESSSSPRAEAPQVKCSRCGRQDETLRLTVMYYVISLFVVTYRRGSSGLWCQKCRIFEAAKWTILSGLLGWWGIPWGPIYTIQALFVNGKGGSQPRSQNAAILRAVGYQLYQQGRLPEAFLALEESLRLEPTVEASQLFDYLRQQKTAAGQRRPAAIYSLAMTAAPSFLMVALFSYGVYRVATEPSGYESTYHAPQAMLAKLTTTPEIGPRSKANDLIADLAGIVESRAPVVGTHHEGTAMVRDHELDRAKFDEKQLYPIADSIGTALHAGTLDSDGFLASAYFNAELFALSVDVINRLDQGRPISSQVDGVLQLGADPAVSAWLQNSRFLSNYATLCRQLRSYSLRYHPGTATEQLLQEYRRQDSELESLKARLEQLKSAGDTDSFNALVPAYNAKVKHLRTVASQGKLQALAAKKLDLAFNRCLDPGILMSKFQNVDLVSHGAEIDSLVEEVPPNQ